jgi:hypothetical protein
MRRTYDCVYSRLDLDLVAIGIQTSSTLKHDFESLFLGTLGDFEGVLQILGSRTAVDPDLVLAVRGTHADRVAGDVTLALQALVVAMNVDRFTDGSAEADLEEADVDVLSVLGVELLGL